jgi:hypothetical protein
MRFYVSLPRQTANKHAPSGRFFVFCMPKGIPKADGLDAGSIFWTETWAGPGFVFDLPPLPQ